MHFFSLCLQGAVTQVLDSLEEITCLTDCTNNENEFLKHVLEDTRLHNLLNVSDLFPLCSVSQAAVYSELKVNIVFQEASIQI